MKYNFNSEIKAKLKPFQNWLQEKHYHPNTIRQKMNYAGYFLQWLDGEQLEPQHARYNDLLNFIDYCRIEGKSKKHINTKLRSIRDYYEYLKQQDADIINPAANLYLKGITDKIPSGLIKYKTLEKLYHQYVANNLREKRNKVILGLLIYQGLKTEELHQLEPGHVKLRQGKIRIPGSRRRNSRVLELKPFQILELSDYLNQTRPQILKELDKPKPARKPAKINKNKLESKLFASINGSEHIKNSLYHLFKRLRKTNPDIQNPRQIRASVITHWLKHYNLRQVQYMAGHKHVHSSERYKMNNLENLQGKLEKLHPLNNSF